MRTFEAILYGILHGLTSYLPLSPETHHQFLGYVLNAPNPPQQLFSALYFGSTLALLIYFRHDYLSLLSSSLIAILSRRKLTSLDERYPLFILLSCAPFAGSWIYLRPYLQNWNLEFPALLGIFGSIGLVLFFTQGRNKKNKGIFDWNFLDVLFVGVARALQILPGVGDLLPTLTVASMKNYRMDGVIKFLFITSLPISIFYVVFYSHELNFHAPEPESGLSWLTFGMAALTAFVSSLFSMNALMKTSNASRFGGYAVYRIVVAMGLGVYWYLT